MKPDDSGLHYNLSKALDRKGQLAEAISHLQTAVMTDPGFAKGQFDLGNMLVRAGRYDEAVQPLRKAVSAEPADLIMRHTLAVALYKAGRCEDAVKEYYGVLEVRRDFVPSLSGLAWLRATHPDPGLRDADEAVALAERAARIEGKNPNVLNTLAAAYAEAGRFEEANAAAKEAIFIAEQIGMNGLAENIRARAQSYQQGRPYRESMGN